MREAITEHTPIEALEISVRTLSVLKRQNIRTLGQAHECLDTLQKYAKGWGRRATQEITELYRHVKMSQEDFYKSPEFIASVREDKLGSVQALMQEVERRLLRVALKGQLSKDQRSQIIHFLRSAAEHAAAIPAVGDD